MTTFTLHPQLLADCHLLGRLAHGHLLLHRNAAVPWFILVPETKLGNLLDLPAPQRDGVLADAKGISDYLALTLGYPNVNVAWLGNVVPQLTSMSSAAVPATPAGPARCGVIWSRAGRTRRIRWRPSGSPCSGRSRIADLGGWPPSSVGRRAWLCSQRLAKNVLEIAEELMLAFCFVLSLGQGVIGRWV